MVSAVNIPLVLCSVVDWPSAARDRRRCTPTVTRTGRRGK